MRFVARRVPLPPTPPDVFRDVVARDVAKWIKVVKAANIKQIQ